MTTCRRDALALGLGFLASPLTSFAQQPVKVARIGVMVSGRTPEFASRVEALRQGLRDLGYVEGRNIAIEYRSAEGKTDRIPELFAELVRLRVDVIVTHGVHAGLKAKEATSTIPVVMANVGDPVAATLVASLARPGGNITGLSVAFPEITAKGLELLRETLPRATRLAALVNPANPLHEQELPQIGALVRSRGAMLQVVQARSASELDGAFSLMQKNRADAVMVFDDQLFVSQQALLAKLALDARLPTIFSQPENVEAGGLMSYGARLADMWLRAAVYIDKILKGAKPADLPVEQPTKFDLVVNLRTARALGIKIPGSVLLRADKVIE